MASTHPMRKAAVSEVRGTAPEIPDKLYFRIGDVARLCDVAAYVLRFWETEFPQLKPNKGGTGQRLYRRKDVEIALRIKHLLYTQGFTIPGARQILKDELRPTAAFDAAPGSAPERTIETANDTRLAALQQEMQALHTILSEPCVGADEEAGVEAAGVARMQPRLVASEGTGQHAEMREEHAETAAERMRRLQGDLFGGG